MTQIINMNSESSEDMNKSLERAEYAKRNEEEKDENDVYGHYTNGGIIIPIAVTAFIVLVLFVLWIFSKIQ